MAIPLDMYNLIIRVDALNRHYPGGFEQYKKDNQRFIEDDYPVIWFDDDLVREGAMSAYDIEKIMESYEAHGLTSFEGSIKSPKWIDMCIMPTFGDLHGQCDWLELVEPRIIQFCRHYGSVAQKADQNG